MLRSAEVQTSGNSFAPSVALRSPAISSSSVSVPASKNFSIRCSSFSATISINASRALSTAAVMSAGTAPFGALAALVGLEDVGFLRHQIDHAAEVTLFADRQLNRDDGAVQRLAQRRQGPFEAGAIAIEAVHDDETRHPELFGGHPDLLGLHHDAADRIDHDDRGVGDVQGGAGIGKEVAHARRIDEIDLLLVPFGVGDARRQRVLPRDLFFVEVGHGRAFVDLPEAIDHAGVGEDGRCELGLAGSAVPDEGDISDAGGVVDLHGPGPPN